MGSSLWDKLGLPLLIGVASPILVAALCFMSVRLWNCLMRLFNTQTTVGESADDQPLPNSAAAAPANDVPDLEMGNDYGPAQGGESMTEPELKLRIVNGDQGIEHFSGQETHTSPPRLRSLEMPQVEPLCVPKWTFLILSKRKSKLLQNPMERQWRRLSLLSMIVALLVKHLMGVLRSSFFSDTGEVVVADSALQHQPG